MSTNRLRKYSPMPFPSPSMRSEDAMPPERLSRIRLQEISGDRVDMEEKR